MVFSARERMVTMAEAIQPEGQRPRSDGERRPLSKFVMASYGAPATPLALAGLPMAVYLPAIYADPDGFGLSLLVVGTLIVLSRFTDVLTDPLIGFISDRIRTPIGRRKPFVLLGTPIFALGMWLLFVPPIEFTETEVLGWSFSSGYTWMFLMIVVVYLGSTIKDLPYQRVGRRALQGLQRAHADHELEGGFHRRRGSLRGLHSRRHPVLRLYEALRRRLCAGERHVRAHAARRAECDHRGARVARRRAQAGTHPDPAGAEVRGPGTGQPCD